MAADPMPTNCESCGDPISSSHPLTTRCLRCDAAAARGAGRVSTEPMTAAPHEAFDFGMDLDGRHIENIRCRVCIQPWPCQTTEINRLRAALPDPAKLWALADWIDLKYPNDSNPEVQRDLRAWARGIMALGLHPGIRVPPVCDQEHAGQQAPSGQGFVADHAACDAPEPSAGQGGETR